MRRIVLTLIVVLCFTSSAFCQKEKAAAKATPENDLTVPPRPLDQWTFLQIGLLPQWPGFTKVSNVYGIKLGAPMCSGYGRVFGIEPSLLYSGTRHVWGIQGSFWGTCLAQEIRGIQASSFGPSLTTTLFGLQATGSLGMAREVRGAQIGPVNMCDKQLTGFQFGAVNIARPVKGFQGGAVNISENVKGFQLGVFNYCKKEGIQFGLINIIEDGTLPFTILFNIN